MNSAASSNAIIDLEELSVACRPLVLCYRRICAGAEPIATIVELDQALTLIKTLPPVPGRLGRAIRVLAAGGKPGFPEATIAALEVLSSHRAIVDDGDQKCSIGEGSATQLELF